MRFKERPSVVAHLLFSAPGRLDEGLWDTLSLRSGPSPALSGGIGFLVTRLKLAMVRAGKQTYKLIGLTGAENNLV